MMNRCQNYLFLIIIALPFSCAKDKTPASQTGNIDQTLLALAKDTSLVFWYKKSDELLAKSAESGHAYPFLKTRFNDIAAQQLDANGKIKSNAQFADGSLIVKELINSDSSIDRYAILYKKADNANADGKGWVWGYIDADGTVAVEASQRGSSCISCHTQSGNIDYMLMNKFFP